ncbi:hypothetical protein QTP86_017287 [Hemibagrus guttatus]|nr:hypothetical protein QTP86_017287 [Hemibagrus guttatus]
MTAIGAVDLQGAGGNWATVGRRSRGGRRVHRQREKRKGKSVGLRIGTLNVGTMTGKGKELADMMERRKVDILCVQETRWKGSKARSIGAGFKLFYYGVDSKRNGVGVVLKEEFVRNVLEVKRLSDRVMSLKLEIERVMLNVVSGYAPQVGCELEEKERFWSELDEVIVSIPTGERVVIGADFNGHVGEGNTGDEEVMGKFGVKERNLEGQMVVDFAKRMDMTVVNTYFQKREEHRVTYKSGGRRTQVDYILCRRGNLKEISDCKVVVGESVARQHRMVLCRMTLMVCKKKRSEIEKKTKWWKLKKEECCEEFRQKLRQALGGQVLLPDDWETTEEVIRETGRKVLGVSSGRRKEDKETWWWNEEVQDSIQRKRLAKKKWDMGRTEENRQEYKELQRRVKREVSKAKQKAYDELYTRLDTRDGEKDLYRRDRDGKDVQQVRVIKDRDRRVLTSEESIQRRWKEYFEELMNEENEREKRVEGVNSVEQKVDKIRKDEVRKALKRMKSGKAVGPDDIPVEVWKCLGEAAVEFLASLFNRVLESERMPEEWRRSVLVPIFKNKGDVQSCSNYRGIKLMSHTMKVWERVVEARLRKVVEICEQQYGFMPRKSTTDAIFALRILMEKYRDGQRELHCVFVDLEKAYDRVPREELWYCMRKSGVAEKYVRVVQDMYERSRTVVRCAVGQTEEFNVEVGLHQGSALSPFLFAIVMDQLSEEVRQESPWTMMFADDIVICSESREQVEENLERWRFALERRGMKVSHSKTEYMCVNEREGSGTVRLQGEEVKKVQELKYLGSTVQSNGECVKEVKKRVQAGWNGWRNVLGVLCDRKISARIKGKVYRTVVRAAMLYGLDIVSLRKRQESELEVAELKMLRFSLGVTRLDRIRNEYIRGTAHVGRLGDKVREARLRWFGHVQRRESEYIGRRMLDMELPGRRQRGRPKRRNLKTPEAEEACASLTKVLGTNPLLLRELDLSGKISGDSGVKQLSVLLKDPHCRPETLRLNKSSITHRGCTDLISALTSNPSHLTELDLSENTLGNSAMDKISTLLQNSSCKLQKLVLSDCNIKEEGYTALAEALKSNPSSHLIELDLRGNDPGESGMKQIRNFRNDPKCKLKTLRVLKSPDAQKASDHLTEVLGINPILQTDLNLSGKIDGDSGVEQLSVLLKDLLKDPHCRPETLQLSECNVTEKGCSALLTALRSEHSTLKELNLSKNRIQDSGVKLLSEELKNKLCKLETLRLSDCSITEEGYSALAEALKSSHLIELDLRGNDPGASGVKLLTDLLQDPDCKLNTLRLLKSPDAEEAYTCLTKMFSKNPLLHTELDLSNKTPEDVKVKQLSALLQDPHYRLQKLTLYIEDSMTDDDCSHVISALVLNPSHLRELNLNRNKPGESGLRDLCDFLKNPKCTLQTLKLQNSVSEKSCTDLVSALCTNPSHIRELDLSVCELGDSGVEKLCDLLKKHKCKLEKLLLSDCNITEEGYTALIKALKSNCSSLIELDLRGNDPGPSGLKELRNLMNDKKCKLKTLRVLKSPDAQKASDHLTEVLGINPILQTDLNLSGKIDGDSGVEQLSVLLKDPQCRPETLQLSECNVTEKGCSALLTALRSEHSTLKELNLSKNRIQDSGVKLLSEELKNKLCKLETLSLMDNNIREEGYTALSEALKSSHLIELDLRGNDPGASGVKLLTDLLQDQKLKTLRLLKSPDAVKACEYLTEVLGTNPLLQRELDLRGKIKGDSGVKQLSALLKDSHCRPETLMLKDCSITEEGCSALSSSFHSNPEHIREMDLSENKFGNSGVQKLCALLQHQSCNLQILSLSDCSITEEGYSALSEALKSSHLIELDLRGNDPGASGVKLLTDLLQDPDCKLNTLRLLKSPDAEEAYTCLTKMFSKNPLLHTELDLSNKTPEDVKVKQLSALLQDPHYRLQKLTLWSSIRVKSSADLVSALCTNPSHIRELDLSWCELGDSGVEKLCDLLKKHECKLEKLQLWSSVKGKSCTDLFSALCTNPSHIRELDLSWCELGDSGVEKLCDLLKKHECKLEKLQLRDSVKGKSCTDLVSALCTNPSHIRELDLSECELEDSGVEKLCDLLKKHECKLEKLLLWSSVKGKSCTDLVSALCTNPSHIRELDLSVCELGDSGVEKLCDLLKKHECKLEKLRLILCSITDRGCAALTAALEVNSSHLKEMNLMGNKLGNSVRHLEEILKRSGGKLI